MNNQCTQAQQRVIDALIAIVGLDEPSLAHLGEGQRMTITHKDCTYVLEEDGTVRDGGALLARDSQDTSERNAPKMRTLLDAIDLDDRLNREERVPTGDDYNTVMELVRNALLYCPLLTFDADAQDIALRVLGSMEGYKLTLNGSEVELDEVRDAGLTVRDWTQQLGAHGAPRIIAWAEVKTIHVH